MSGQESHTPEIWRDPAVDTQLDDMQALVTVLRRVRHDFNIGPGQTVPVDIVCAAADRRERLAELSDYLGMLAKAEPLTVRADDRETGVGIHVPVGEFEAVVLLADVIDVGREVERIRGRLAGVEKDLGGLRARLSNEGFVGNAPADVVAKVRARSEELAIEAGRLRQHLASLGG